MTSFFEPKSVAVAGASTDPEKLGSIIFSNLIANRDKGLLRASVFALNPAYDRIGSEPCYRDIGSLPSTPELLVVAVPESHTIGLIKDAAEAGVKAAIVIAGGYSEVGKGDDEAKIGKLAARHGMRILGPNTIGLLDTRSGVDSLFLRSTKKLPSGTEIVSRLSPLPGGVAVITQSGHLGETISEELAANGVGVRAIVGTGNQLDVSVEEVIEHFADDEHTKVVVVYLEGVREGRRFMEAASYASKRKPVVVFKVGKTSVGARAALTHTASLVGNYAVYRAAFRQSGVVEANNLQELVDYSIALSMLPKPAGRRLVIVTNAGGVGAIAADEAGRLGMVVDPLEPEGVRRVRSEFGGTGFIVNASLGNPIDLTASVTTDELARATELVISSPQYDLGLVLPTHQAPGIGFDVAEKLSRAVARAGKPVSMAVVGQSPFAEKIHSEFMSRGIPSYPTPERAAGALAACVDYEELRRNAKAPVRVPKQTGQSGQGGSLPPDKASRLLASYGIGGPKSVVVRSAKDLGRLRMLRFPVACKLQARGLLHKTDVGGVEVGIRTTSEAASAFARFEKVAKSKQMKFDGMLVQEMVRGTEVIIGGTRDPTFGPVVLVGLGGIYTELLRDFDLAVAPIDERDAKRLLSRGRLGRALEGYRGGPRVGLGRLSKAIANFSRILAENPAIEQIEVNPLMVTQKAVVSVDARVVLKGSSRARSVVSP